MEIRAFSAAVGGLMCSLPFNWRDSTSVRGDARSGGGGRGGGGADSPGAAKIMISFTALKITSAAEGTFGCRFTSSRKIDGTQAPPTKIRDREISSIACS